MTEQISKSSPRLQARIAGFLYLIIIAVGGTGYFIGQSMIVSGDAATTARNILASEQMWRAGVAGMLIMLACDVGVATIFYVLFKPVNRTLALAGFAFRIVLVGIQGFALVARFAPLLILKDAAFDAEQAQALAYLSLRLFNRGFQIGLFFFGFDCLLIGWLILRSTFLPRILGALMMLAGLCYLIDFFATFLFPALDPPFDILLPAYVAEVALTLWLIAMGVNADKWKAQANAAAAA